MKDIKMDANKLIAEVYKRPALWNQRHRSYHNREITNNIWLEMSEIFKLSKPLLKAKWKGLRDTFRAELKKEILYRKNKLKRHRPQWIHFKSLQFLRDQMVPRPPVWEQNNRTSNRNQTNRAKHGNKNNNDGERNNDDSLSNHLLWSSMSRLTENVVRQGVSEIKDETKIKEEESDDFEYHNVSSTERINDEETIMQNLSPENVIINASIRDETSEINGLGDNCSIDVLPNGQQYDDNYYFLVSLLPHMRKLSAERTMFLRMKIQELVYNEVYQNSTENLAQRNSTTS